MQELRIVQIIDRETGRWTYFKTVDASEARKYVRGLRAEGYMARSIRKGD